MAPHYSIFLHTPEDQDTWAAHLRELRPGVALHTGGNAPLCDYALVWNPPVELLARQTKLRAVFALGAGVDSLLTVVDRLPPGVPIIRVEDAGMADQMVEYSLFAVLETLRRMREYRAAQASRQWAPAAPLARSSFSVGVLGLGTLGTPVARELARTGFPVWGWSRTPRDVPGVQCCSGTAGMREVLEHSNVVIVLVPLTDDTRGILNSTTLAMLPRRAVVVNLARGAVVDDQALLEHLDSGGISHAYLDVFSTEPLPQDHRFWTHRGVTVTPHIAAQTPVDAAARQIICKIERLEAGEEVTGVVNPHRGY